MKTIGLIGGMSWESTIGYYKEINQRVKKALGGLHSAKIVLHSVDFDPIEKLQHSGNWAGTAEILIEAAKSVESAGADFVLICTNTMHKVASDIEQNINIPLLHIADATAEALVKDGIKKVGLLGTAFTMEQDFYKQRLIETYGLEVVIPNGADRKLVHDTIYNELCLGNIHDASRQEYLRIVNELAKSGAEAIILGCTEIGMLINQQHTDVPLYDTTAIHAAKAVEWAIQ
ncbi:aspartate/glutamate racemase family protein [Kangiella sp. M94]